MRHVASRLRRRLAAEGGFTLVELMAAMMILVVGVMSTIALMDRARQLGDRNEAREAIAFQAERELEKLLEWSFPADRFARLGHRTTPAPGAAGTPAARITADGAYKFDGRNLAREEALFVPGGVPAGQPVAVEQPVEDWLDGQTRLAGKVYRFVTEADGEEDMRRVTVVVTVDPPAVVPPLYMSTLVTDPRP